MTRRWVIVLVTALVLIATPLAVGARPAADDATSAHDLAERMVASQGLAWSGFAQTSGALAVPQSDDFATLGTLLGEDNELRVWWRSANDWRVDRVRGTGETDLFRTGALSIRWVFESETATYAPVSTIRLPDASDLLPPTLARSLLQGFRPDELSRLATRRIAGISAPGVRLTPRDPSTTVAYADLWADPTSGLPLAVELYGRTDPKPVLRTALRDVDLRTPAASTTRFAPGSDVKIAYDQSVDVAASANAYAPFDLPRQLAGLEVRDGTDPGAVGVYGRGPTTLLALPLRDGVARPLRQRLRDSATAQASTAGALAVVGPVSLLVTRRYGGGGFLLAGTVTPATLERAASELGPIT